MSDRSPDQLCAIGRRVEEIRSRYVRLEPHEALEAQRRGALLVDTRTEAQRLTYGAPPSSIAIDRTVLEWRLDPSSPWRLDDLGDLSLGPIIFCQGGYSSSLAVDSLRALGLTRSTDVIGGFDLWCSLGLPITRDLPPRVP